MNLNESPHANTEAREQGPGSGLHVYAQRERTELLAVVDRASRPELARISYREFSFGAVERKEEEEVGGRPTPPLSLLQAALSIRWQRCRSGLFTPGRWSEGHGVHTDDGADGGGAAAGSAHPEAFRYGQPEEGEEGEEEEEEEGLMFNSEGSVCFRHWGLQKAAARAADEPPTDCTNEVPPLQRNFYLRAAR